MATAKVTEDAIFEATIVGWAARLAGEGDGHLSVRPLGDGRAVYLCDMAFGNLRLAVGEFGAVVYDDVWCYQQGQTDAAWRAALGWDGQGEPDGWYRHPGTGRRRPGGDPAQERVHW